MPFASSSLSRILCHSFNQKLGSGILPQDIFQFYLAQDAEYLRDFASVLKRLSQRCPDERHAERLMLISKNTIESERKMQQRYLRAPSRQAYFFQGKTESTETIPVIESYTQHLFNASESGSIAEGVVSCVPCFVIYKTLGEQMNARCQERNPYLSWIASYSSPKFVDSCRQMIQIADELMSQSSSPLEEAKIVASFLTSVRYEEKFFDACLLKDMPYFPESKDVTISCRPF
jgi:thiaminase